MSSHTATQNLHKIIAEICHNMTPCLVQSGQGFVIYELSIDHLTYIWYIKLVLNYILGSISLITPTRRNQSFPQP